MFTRRSRTKKRESILTLIAVFKYLKAVLLIAVGFDLLHLMHRDLFMTLMTALDELHLNADNAFVHRIVSRILSVDPAKLELFAAVTFTYAAVFLTEGTGLFLRKRWAEYFTIVMTGSFIPIEIYEAIKHHTAFRIITICLNIAIVLYLVYHVNKVKSEK